MIFDHFAYVTESINNSFIYLYDDVVYLFNDNNLIQACGKQAPLMFYCWLFADIKGQLSLMLQILDVNT